MVDTIGMANAVASSPTYNGRMARQINGVGFAGATAARPLGALTGVRPGTPSNTVTVTSSTWTCQPFAGLADVMTAAVSGAYPFAFDAVATGAMTAADASNPRIDIVWVKIVDPEDGTTTPTATRGYLAGAPLATPVAPAPPAGAFTIAQINVPKSGGGSPTVTWVAPYTFTAGGTGRVNTFNQLPASATQGDMYMALDTGVTWRWYDLYNGATNPSGRKTAGWKPWETAVPISYTTALVNYTPASDVPVQLWSARGGQIKVEGKLTIASGGGMTGNLAVMTPFPMADKYLLGTYSLGTGAYLVPATVIYELGVVSANATDRVTPLPKNAAAVSALSFEAGVTASLPTGQSAGYTVSWFFEYDPA